MRREDNPKFSGYTGPKDESGIPVSKTPHNLQKPPTPRINAKKIESNAKKIEKLMGMVKGKGK